MFGRNDFLGEVTIPLDYHNLDDTTAKWYQLQERVGVNRPKTLLFSYIYIYIYI